MTCVVVSLVVACAPVPPEVAPCAEAEFEDRVTFPPQQTAFDALFVIDGSPSMIEERTHVADEEGANADKATWLRKRGHAAS